MIPDLHAWIALAVVTVFAAGAMLAERGRIRRRRLADEIAREVAARPLRPFEPPHLQLVRHGIDPWDPDSILAAAGDRRITPAEAAELLCRARDGARC